MAEPSLAVLTGDLVRSSALAPGELDRAVATLAEAAGEAGAWDGTSPRFTRFRGDGWQCLAPPGRWLRACLLLRARLRSLGRGLDTRIAVGLGAGDPGEGADLAAAAGPAFRAGGHLLDRLPRARRMAVAWDADPPCAGEIAALVALCDVLAERWTPAQGGVLAAMLAPEPPVQADLARRLGVTQQVIAKHLRAAGEPALLTALEAVENHG